MGYASGTITNANAADLLYTEIETLFTAHANWDHVETISSGGIEHEIWRNNGANNSFGSNFFIAIIYDATGGLTLDIKCFESWDGTNDKAIRPCVGATGSRTPNANGSYGNETTGFVITDTTDMAYGRVSTPTTGYDYFIQVSQDRICVATKFSTTDHAIYAGLYESLLASDPFPICVGGTNGQENLAAGNFGLSRMPNKTIAATNNFQGDIKTWSDTSGTTEAADLMHGTAVASRVLLYNTGNVASTYGIIRGLLYDCCYLPDGATATRNGDALPISAVNWRKMKFGTVSLSVGVWVKETSA
jgi:hypothetical protein